MCFVINIIKRRKWEICKELDCKAKVFIWTRENENIMFCKKNIALHFK